MNDDLIANIKHQVSILSYLEQAGYTPIRHGNRRYRLKEHDSLVFDEQHFWWNSRGVSGSVIDLCMELEGHTQKEAIHALARRLNGRAGSYRPTNIPPSVHPAVPFVLPKISTNNWPRVYAYLLKTRAIHPDVVRWLAKEKVIYPDARGNLCYVSSGYDGKPNYAALKGTNPEKSYRHVIDGSDCTTRAAFCLMGRSPTELFVCEAAIDAFSLMSLLHVAGQDFTQYGYLSLECCYEGPLIYHLAHNPQIKHIWLAQDLDDAGLRSRERCIEALKKNNYQGQVQSLFPTQKDWNESLQSNQNEGGFTIVNDEQAIRIQCNLMKNTGLVTSKMIFAMMRAALRAPNSIQHGQQSLKKLDLQNRTLENMKFRSKALQEVKQQLKAYSVDFAILQDKNSPYFEVWFKGQDINRINTALENCVADKIKETSPEEGKDKDLHTVCEQARQAAQAQNESQVAAQPTQEREVGA